MVREIKGGKSFNAREITLNVSHYSPALKKWGLYWVWVVCHSVHPSFRLS